MPPTALFSRLALAVALTGTATQAAAAQLELQAGRSYMDRHPTTAAFVEVVFASHPLGETRFSWAPDLSLGWIEGRDVARYRGQRFDTADAVWLGAAGVRLRHRDVDRGWFVSEQLAGIHGRTQALSSGYQFVSTLGWQGQRLSMQLRHVSNGGLHDPNRGETMLLLGVRFGSPPS